MKLDALKLLYGDQTKEEVIAKKSTEKQIRSFSSGSKGVTAMSVDACKKLCKELNDFEYLKGYEQRLVKYTITDETVDRYGDIVRAKGALLQNFKNNPVVQFAHDYSQPPVGVGLDTKFVKAKSAVQSTTLFYDDRVDKSGRSDLIFRFVQSKGMNCCSIGFLPKTYNDPADPEERETLGLGHYGVEFLSWDLLEFSPVPVPANPAALQDSYRLDFQKTLKSGLFTPADAKILLSYESFAKAMLDDDSLDTFISELKNTTITVPEIKAKTPEGNWKYCECGECGHYVEHKAGEPCEKCPECGTQMSGTDTKPKSKEMVDALTIEDGELNIEDGAKLQDGIYHLHGTAPDNLESTSEGATVNNITLDITGIIKEIQELKGSIETEFEDLKTNIQTELKDLTAVAENALPAGKEKEVDLYNILKQ